MELVTYICEEVKKKPQLNHLNDTFVCNHVEQFLLRNGDISKKLHQENLHSKNSYVKQVVKMIREEIGLLYGCYLTSQHSRKYRFLKENNYEKLLFTHKSTRERSNNYEEFYSLLASWKLPEIGIADLACGMNPISYPLFERITSKSYKYFVCDINDDDMSFLNMYFSQKSINGIALSVDITQLEFLKNPEFIECDMVFLLKALDSVESIKKGFSQTLIESLPQSYVVVSFPLRALVSNKQVSPSKRNWFIRFLEDKQWDYTTTTIGDELFFLINK